MHRRHLVLSGLLVVAAFGLVVYANPSLVVSDYDTTTVSAVDGDTGAHLASVEVRIADTNSKRYLGLSDTEELGPNEGMLFVHDEPGTYGYVMRDMAFGIDIVFADASGQITVIYEAEPEPRPLTTYEGSGQYVLEVPMGWSASNDVTVGDELQFDRP